MNSPVGCGFSGEIDGLSLVDIVQFACLSRDERKLTVLHEGNQGLIYFADNEIVHAEFGELVGEDAFYRIMSWPSGTFRMIFSECSDRTIDSSWNFLLLEVARRFDEQEDEPEQEKSEQLGILVVDDSRLFTKAFVKLFEEKIDASVVGTANNGKEAVKFLEMQVPDLVTLDINMPVMGGEVALKHIMIRSPAPVVLVSSFNDQVCLRLMDYMRFGAVDVVAKPVTPKSWTLVSDRLQYILNHVKEFRVDNVSRAKLLQEVDLKSKLKPEKVASRLVLIIGGLGGMLELQKIIPFLKYDNAAAILVMQNMYPTIDRHLATYLNQFTPYTVLPLTSGSQLLGGQCLIGDSLGRKEILFEQDMITILTEPENDADEDEIEPPEGDSLLDSASGMLGAALTVVVLSGVEQDVKQGLGNVFSKGGRIILQDPDSCLYPGPVEDIKTLGVEEICLKPEDIAQYLADHP